jgi:hypothetical protein
MLSKKFVRPRIRVAARCMVFASIAASLAQAAPPAAPVVTVGADIKQLRFDWDYVPTAGHYELWYQPHAAAAWVKYGETPNYRPRKIISIPVHLLNWEQARYEVRACNRSGCTASPPIDVSSHMFDTIGYFKAQVLHNKARLGLQTAISEDGNTLAAFTAGETVPNFPKAAVYVFTKIDGRWRQQARIFPESNTAPWRNTGLRHAEEASLSLSADGNLMVAAMPFRDQGFDSGAVTVYRRSGGTWTQEYQLLQIETITGQLGSFFAEVNDAGDRILYRRTYNAPVEVIERTTSGWQRRAIANPPYGLPGYTCPTVKFSGNGETIAWACTHVFNWNDDSLFISRPPNWQLMHQLPLDFPADHYVYRVALDFTGDTIAVSSAAGSQEGTDLRDQVRVFKAPAASDGFWERSAPIHAGSWTPPGQEAFGEDLALSHDGALLAILDPRDMGAGMGVLSPPLQPSAAATGAAYIYELRAQGPRLRRVLKPNNAIPEGGLSGGKVAFARNGRTLAVSEPDEPGSSQGIDGDRTAAGRVRTGAIWLY